jgi:PAS domain S-box-containing protein
VSAAVRDVSDRTEAEERISELALIVESSQDAILTKTLDGVITFWNAAAARMYGYTAQQAVGRHVSMLAPPGHQEEIDALLARVRRGERVDHYETLRMTSTGNCWMWTSWCARCAHVMARSWAVAPSPAI